MGYYATVLVKGPAIEELKADLELWTGHRFVQLPVTDRVVFTARVLDTDFQIFRASFEDDQGMPLSAYDLAVDVEFGASSLGNEHQKPWVTALALLIAGHLYVIHGWRCLAVYNLQVLLGCYPPPAQPGHQTSADHHTKPASAG